MGGEVLLVCPPFHSFDFTLHCVVPTVLVKVVNSFISKMLIILSMCQVPFLSRKTNAFDFIEYPSAPEHVQMVFCV